jgi:uncharacterized membrane protein YcfT
MSGRQRLSWVDTAKGISIILVVMMYCVFNVGQDADGVGLFHYVIAFATPLRMPEFFLISGLFLSEVIGRSWARYADRRVVHYFYFYALWAVIHIGLKIGLTLGHPVEALQQIALAVVEPYGVLWFIYLLAVFSATAKLAFTFKVPHWMVLAIGAALQIPSFSVPQSYLVEQFCHYFVFFYAGYVFAPKIFRLVGWAMDHARLAVPGLVAWAALEAALVFSPGFGVYPDHVDLGLAGLPGLRLALAVIGSVALCVTGGLLSKLSSMDWLRWLGEHSLVVYVTFVLPMTYFRAALVKLDLVANVTFAELAVMLVAIGFSVLAYLLTQRTGLGKWLYARPAWAHIPGTPGSRSYEPAPRLETVPAIPAE